MFLNTYSPNQIRRHAQSGAALVVSLIMLSLMTAIGVASMEATILESKMAGNLQAQIDAFNNTESSLRLAEGIVLAEANDAVPVDFSTQTWLYTATDSIPLLDELNVTLDDIEIDLDNTNSAVGDNARYIVWYTGSHTLAGESSALNSTGGVSGSAIHIFQIDSRNDDLGQGAIQVVRSKYATLNAP